MAHNTDNLRGGVAFPGTDGWVCYIAYSKLHTGAISLSMIDYWPKYRLGMYSIRIAPCSDIMCRSHFRSHPSRSLIHFYTFAPS